jgi:hypothetical protein
MERGSMQVRVAVDGARGAGKLAVPVPAIAQKTLAMTRGLGTLLLALMVLLVVGIVCVIGGAVREGALEPGADVPAPARRRARIATAIAAAAVIALVVLGNLWWSAEAAAYQRSAMQPLHPAVRVDGCTLHLGDIEWELLPDHGHLMHLFLVRDPDFEQVAHLHPSRDEDGNFTQQLPSLPAGRYLLFADIVFTSGFPMTGTATVDLPELHCAPLAGDDAMWAGTAAASSTFTLPDGARVTWQRPAELRANVAAPLRFHVDTADGKPAALEPYMGMAAHAMIARRDASVFAHLHPSGSVAMPALELAQGGATAIDMAMPMTMPMPASFGPDLAFPYGFPRPGDYRIFVQIKLAGRIETAVFDANVGF